MGQPIFHLGLLDKYQLVFEPGTYKVKAAVTVTEEFLVFDEHPRYLVPLRVISANKLQLLLQDVPKEDMKIPFSRVAHYFSKGAIWESDVLNEDDLPIKGEELLCTFDEIDGDLLCTRVELLPRRELEYLNLNNISKVRQLLANLLSNNTNNG
jgi:hypothetical protein